MSAPRPDAPQLCAHLRDAAPGSRPFEIALVLGEHLGLRDGVARCTSCGAHALLRLLEWEGPRLRRRRFAVAAVGDRDVELLRRELRSGSCDLGRPGRAVEAFLACAGPVERVLAFDVEAGTVVAS